MKGVITSDLRRDITLIYVGVFGRAPDGEGLNYWMNEFLRTGVDLRTLADWMYHSAVSHPSYSYLGDPRKLVEQVYKQVLGRRPEVDPEGINYWVNEVRSGKVTPGKVVADILWVATQYYKDSEHTKNLLNIAEIALYVSQKIYKPDLDQDGKVSPTEMELFKGAISLNLIDVNKDGKITELDVQGCKSIIDSYVQESISCILRGCPSGGSPLLPMPDLLTDDFEDLYDYILIPGLPSFPSTDLTPLSVLLLGVFSEALQVLNKNQISIERFKNLELYDPEMYQIFTWYKNYLATSPTYLDFPDLSLPCFTIKSMRKGPDQVYLFEVEKEGVKYNLTAFQIAYLVYPQLKEFALEVIQEPDPDYPEETAWAQYFISLIGKTPLSPCPIQLGIL